MRRFSLLAVILFAGSLAVGHSWLACDPSSSTFLLAAEVPAARTVEMVIDYGDGVQVRFTALAWREKMTVLDAVSAASAHPHGVKCVWRGTGSTAFLTQIGDQKNEGGGAQSRNWLYSLNNKESEVGFGGCTLSPGDVILWRFGQPDNINN